MDSMKCYDCVMKHVAGALSYAKQILSGHTKNADLDHRIDFLGQLINLQHHIELINKDLLVQIKNYRQIIQNKDIMVEEYDLQYLRQLFQKIQRIKNQENFKDSIVENLEIDSLPNVVFLHIKDKDYFDLCYKKLRENLVDYDDIFYIESDIDLSDYGIKKTQLDKIDSEYLYIINERDIILNKTSAKTLLRIQDNKHIDYRQIVSIVKKNQPYYYYEDFPVLVKLSDYKEYADRQYPITIYCNRFSVKNVPMFNIAFKLDKELCCSNRSKMKTAKYVYLQNEIALNSVKKYQNVD